VVCHLNKTEVSQGTLLVVKNLKIKNVRTFFVVDILAKKNARTFTVNHVTYVNLLVCKVSSLKKSQEFENIYIYVPNIMVFR